MYREFKPIAPLRPYVQCIWTMKARGEDFIEPQRLVPDGNIEVMLNQGDSYSQAWTDDKKNINTHKGSCLVGQHIIHERKLQRDFDHHVGVTPKFLQRVLRFRQAAHTMFSASCKNLTGLAYECGYYDQAHFINEFKYFSGLSPRQFLQECGKELSPAWLEE